MAGTHSPPAPPGTQGGAGEEQEQEQAKKVTGGAQRSEVTPDEFIKMRGRLLQTPLTSK
jgi:hypothetical protein